MADVLTVVAKIRAAKGKGDALAALLKEQAGVCARRSRAASSTARTARRRIPISSSSTSSTRTTRPSTLHRKAPHLAAYRERREKEGLTEGPAEVEIYRSLTD